MSSEYTPTLKCAVAYCNERTTGLVCKQHASFGAFLIAEIGSGIPGDQVKLEKPAKSLIELLAAEDGYLFGEVNY